MKCENCKWWWFDRLTNKGKCYRYPPKISLRKIDDVRPITRNEDFCGEFKEKNNEPIQE